MTSGPEIETEPIVLADPAEDSPKRLAIIEAACDLFLDQGYGTTSMDQIAAVAEVSKRTVYSHFESKEALFEGVMNGLCVRLAGECPLGEEWRGPPEQVLTIAGRWLLTLITRSEAVALHRVVTSESARLPQLGEMFFRMGPGRMIDLFARYLVAQDEAGTLTVSDPQAAATRLFELIRGPIHMPQMLGLREPPDEDEINRAVDEAVRLFLTAHAPR